MLLSNAITAFLTAVVVVSIFVLVLVVFVALVALNVALRAKKRGMQNLQGQHIRR